MQQLPLHIKGILGNDDIVNTYFLVSGGEGVLIDAGQDAEVDSRLIIDKWRELGEPRMRSIVLTHGHPDHVGAATILRERWHAPIAMHRGDDPVLEQAGTPINPDIELTDGMELDTPMGTATVLHTPGHSPGSICLYFEGSELLFTGDLVLTNGTAYIGAPFGNMTDYFQSMRRLIGMKVDLLAPGHGPVIKSGWNHLIGMYGYRFRREGEITMALKSGAKNSLEIAKLIYAGRNVSDELLKFGAQQTECHLRHLEKIGVVTREGDRWQLAA